MVAARYSVPLKAGTFLPMHGEAPRNVPAGQISPTGPDTGGGHAAQAACSEIVEFRVPPSLTRNLSSGRTVSNHVSAIFVAAVDEAFRDPIRRSRVGVTSPAFTQGATFVGRLEGGHCFARPTMRLPGGEAQGRVGIARLQETGSKTTCSQTCRHPDIAVFDRAISVGITLTSPPAPRRLCAQLRIRVRARPILGRRPAAA